MDRFIKDISLHQLHVFQAVARHLNFSRAAEALALSQPAVSMHVKQLEQVIGLPLFEKVGRRVYLTDAGRHLLDYSQRVFGLLGEAAQVLEEMKGAQAGNLRVAADTTAGVYVVPAYLGAFRRRHPGVNVTLEVANRSTLTQRLLMNEVDLAVMGQVPPEQNLVAEPFLANELVVVAAPTHRLAGRRRIPVAELAGESFLVRETGSGTRATAERFFAAAGVPLRVGMELGSNSAIKQAVAADLGVAVVPRRALDLELAARRLVVLDVEGFPLVRHWHAVHLREKRLSAAAVAFKSLLLAPGALPAAAGEG